MRPAAGTGDMKHLSSHCLTYHLNQYSRGGEALAFDRLARSYPPIAQSAKRERVMDSWAFCNFLLGTETPRLH